MPRIELEGLTKSYNGVAAVDHASLTVNDGELMALVGHSGCGKTTLLRMISGLTAPEQGRIRLDGQDIAGQKPQDRDVVMVFQENLLFPHLTVAENIGFGLKMQRVPRRRREEKIKELMGLMQLPEIGGRYAAQLSGGQQQRVALARALALEPKVLLLDEPLSNLDPKLRDDLRDLILRLHQELRMTTILVTHDRDEAMMMADRIAVMYYGKILQTGEPSQIYLRPTTREVASLFGPCNFIPGFLNGLIFETGGYRFTMPVFKGSGPAEACVRGEHIKLVRPYGDLPAGVISEKKYAGGEAIFKVALGKLVLIVRGHNYFELEVGSRVGLAIDWSQVSFLEQNRCG